MWSCVANTKITIILRLTIENATPALPFYLKSNYLAHNFKNSNELSKTIRI